MGIAIGLLIALIIGVILFRYFRNKSKTQSEQEDKNKLYRDWILAIYFENNDPSSPLVKYCNIHSVEDNKVIVDCPSMGPDEQTLYWIPKKNNYYFESQLQLLEDKN